MSQRSLLRRHIVTCLAFAIGVAAGVASLAVYNQVTRGSDIILRNSLDHTLATKIQGNWKLKDLRVADGNLSKIAFMSSGVMENDPVYDERWFCIDGVLYLSYTRIDGEQNDRKAHLFSVIPTFDESADTMTIAFPGNEPHAVLKRDRS